MEADPALTLAEAEDAAAIDELVAAAFGRPDEARLVRDLGEGGYLLCELVAKEGERLVGHIAFSLLPIEQQDAVIRGVSLAPLAVCASHRHRGIGAALVREGLVRVHRLGADAVVVLGEPRYYGRFGFSAELGARLSAPFSGPSFMALELMPGSLRGGGRVVYAPPFGVGAHARV